MQYNHFQSELHKDFLKNFSRVEKFYEYPPRLESFRDRLKKIPEIPHRSLVADILRDYNTRLEAPDPVIKNIDRLALEGTSVIIGGQQAGLFTGPLMAVYKAIDIINRAEEASRVTGKTVVPVFWVPGEDHDFEEVNHFWIINAEKQLEKLAIEAHFRTRPISLIPRKKRFLTIIDTLEKKSPPGRFKKDYLDLLRETGQKAETLGEWFSRILVRLVGEHGLVLFDPLAPGAEKLKTGFIKKFKPMSQRFYREILQTEEDLKSSGYHVQVKKDSCHANFFLIIGKERRPIFCEGDRFISRGGDLNLTEGKFWGALEEDPFGFSPDVLLRPLFQDFVFPVLASVNGPGEIAYQAQLRLGYRALELEQPPLFLRRGLTLVEEGLIKYLDKWDISPLQIIEEGEKLRETILSRETGVNIDSMFFHPREEIIKLYQELMGELQEVHPNLEKLGQKNLNRVLKEVDYLEKRAKEFHQEKEKTICNQFSRVQSCLYPGKKPQERVLNIFPFLMKYGPRLLVMIREKMFEMDSEHGFLATDGLWK